MNPPTSREASPKKKCTERRPITLLGNGFWNTLSTRRLGKVASAPERAKSILFATPLQVGLRRLFARRSTNGPRAKILSGEVTRRVRDAPTEIRRRMERRRRLRNRRCRRRDVGKNTVVARAFTATRQRRRRKRQSPGRAIGNSVNLRRRHLGVSVETLGRRIDITERIRATWPAANIGLGHRITTHRERRRVTCSSKCHRHCQFHAHLLREGLSPTGAPFTLSIASASDLLVRTRWVVALIIRAIQRVENPSGVIRVPKRDIFLGIPAGTAISKSAHR